MTNLSFYGNIKSGGCKTQLDGGDIMVNSNKIKGRMKELELTQKDVAIELGIKTPTANQKINNVRSFTLDEAEKLSDMLKIKQDEFGVYFFANKVAKRNANEAF